MKHTIKTTTGRMTVQPLKTENRVLVSMGMPGYFPGLALTPEECAALVFSLEMTLEELQGVAA